MVVLSNVRDMSAAYDDNDGSVIKFLKIDFLDYMFIKILDPVL